MYVRTYHNETDPRVILQFIREHPFAALVSAGDRFPQASHVPMEVIGEDPLVLMGHLSNANPQLAALRSHPDVLVIFQGPDTYVSASWYTVPDVASTWNYIAVHATGRLTLVDSEATLAHITRLTARQERGVDHPTSVDRMPADYVKKNLSAITAFRIEVERLDNTYKLSQNKDETTRENIRRELEKKQDPDAARIAAEMASRKSLDFE